MQMTLNIDDDLVIAATKIAEAENRLVDRVISDLLRQSLPQESKWETRNGFPLLPKRPGSKPVTMEMVNALRDGDY